MQWEEVIRASDAASFDPQAAERIIERTKRVLQPPDPALDDSINEQVQ